MAGRAGDVVVKIATNKYNIQSGDVCVDEFYFLLLTVFIPAVKNWSHNLYAVHLNFTSCIKISKNR
jgi:hypothetical protein